MKLTILGSGSPEAYVRRASSGYLLEIGDDKILFDCGGGVFENLLRSDRKPSDITHIVFSHLHSDHMMDYARLVHAAWDEGGTPIKVFGPLPIASITEGYFGPEGVLAHDLRARTELEPSQLVWLARGGTLPRPWPAPVVTEITEGSEIIGAGWRILPFAVPHGQPILSCLGFRVETPDATFVYSGDAAHCDALETHCRAADLLLHWCYRLDSQPAHPAMERLTPTPSEIAQLAQRAGVKRLLLTHMRVNMDAPTQQAELQAALSQNFTGPSGVAEDLDEFDI
jgi:ribonuclease Z